MLQIVHDKDVGVVTTSDEKQVKNSLSKQIEGDKVWSSGFLIYFTFLTLFLAFGNHNVLYTQSYTGICVSDTDLDCEPCEIMCKTSNLNG